MTLRRRAGGFSLVELMVSVAIVALLAAVAVPSARMVTQRSKEQELRVALREIRTAIDAYKRAAESGRIEMRVGASGYPPSLRVLVEGVEDVKSPQRSRKFYFLRRVPRDPMSADRNQPPEDSWGLRAYASPAEAPQAGEDVFDVYSLSSGKGLDGTPYRNW